MKKKTKIACEVCGDSLLENHRLFNGSRVSRCKDCGLEWRVPKPKRKELEKYYGREYFVQGEGLKYGYIDYDALTPSHQTYFSQQMGRIEGLVGKRQGIIVDVGCGPGIFLNEARSHGFEVIGVDVSREVAGLAKKRYKVPVRVGEFENINFNENSFDVVACFQTFEHMLEPMEFLSSVYRALKPGAWIVLTTPNRDSLWKIFMRNRWFSYQHMEHLYFWGKRSLLKAFSEAGFREVSLFNDTWRYYLVSEFMLFMRTYSGGFAKALPKIDGFLPKSLRVPFPTDNIGIIGRK